MRQRVPGALIVVAGRSPDGMVEWVADCVPGIEVRTDVPDMTAERRRAWVAVAPMRSGSGIKHKMIEAWADERPVVLSGLATKGLHMAAETRSNVCDAPEGTRDAAVHLLENEAERRRPGRTSRAVEERHAWAPAAERLHRLLVKAYG